MYKKQNREKQKDIRVVSLEDLVPRDHLLREIDRAINFDFIYEEVKGLYSEAEWGKPGIDPVSLFKDCPDSTPVWNPKHETNHQRNRSQYGVSVVYWI